jgi:DNA-3-methyladenine glycosylase I
MSCTGVRLKERLPQRRLLIRSGRTGLAPELRGPAPPAEVVRTTGRTRSARARPARSVGDLARAPVPGAVRRSVVRCRWAQSLDPEYTRYHDEEWGRPVHDDVHLFEMLTLEGAQAGLSWATILRKRAGYRRAFADFRPERVARFDARRRAALMLDAGIVRNRLKIESTVSNAQHFLQIQQEFGSFDHYLWAFVDGRPLINRPSGNARLPARTGLSDRISRDLTKRGFRFVGSTIIYAFLQAVGVVNDHSRQCFLGTGRTPRRRADA